MAWLRRREIPMLIVTITGFIMLFEYGIIGTPLSDITTILSNMATILAVFALGLGIISLIRRKAIELYKRTPGLWYFNAWFFILFFTMLISGLVGVPGTHPVFTWLYSNMQMPLDQALFSLTGFYIVMAAYRAFKIRTLEAGVLVISAAIVMLSNAPVGETLWYYFPVIGSWLLEVPNMGASRGIIIGVAIGGAFLCIRTLLGYERGYLRREERT